ncbi:MAG: DUF4381 domain-containing protein [Gammaproteobacteria bacterium]|nr:DUF4381 domain-containing protein [Gammaproteobacteria bacterium]MDH5801711.1 DUF4381 domain-containing protein [Gammaproteobacteria bacterium]
MHPNAAELPLRDIHVPDAIGWWPVAMGWWLLLAFVAVILLLLLFYMHKHKHRHVQKAASREVDDTYAAYRHHRDATRFVRELSVLLRRISVSRYGGPKVAGLTGDSWLAFLDQGLVPHYNRSGLKFSQGVGRLLITVPYAPHNNVTTHTAANTNTITNANTNATIDVDGLHRLAVEWVASLSMPNALDKNLERLKSQVSSEEGVRVSV